MDYETLRDTILQLVAESASDDELGAAIRELAADLEPEDDALAEDAGE